MCFFKTPTVTVQAPAPTAAPAPAPAPAPPPAAPLSIGGGGGSTDAVNPVMSNMYDPTNPESGVNEEKGAARKRSSGTKQLRIDLDPNATSIGQPTGNGLQISK